MELPVFHGERGEDFEPLNTPENPQMMSYLIYNQCTFFFPWILKAQLLLFSLLIQHKLFHFFVKEKSPHTSVKLRSSAEHTFYMIPLHCKTILFANHLLEKFVFPYFHKKYHIFNMNCFLSILLSTVKTYLNIFKSQVIPR